ncbi:MAG: CARDB domain-containing protein, partial [Candidatus Magasanikbacteria bacterium]|nr:CARDB domain-containing protein [Candidatus Magasanikbacteria bacterium]
KTFFLIFPLLLFAIFLAPNPAHAENNLYAISISVAPTSPAKNEPCIITVRVNNIGDTSLADYTGLTTGDISANFKNFTVTKTTLPTLPIAKDSSAYYKYEGSFDTVGHKSLYFNVNINGALEEPSTGNNYIQAYVDVVEPYDYEVNSITVYPSNPGVGEDVMIEIKATNKGFISFTTNQDVGSVAYLFPNFVIDETVWPTPDYDENKIETNDIYYYRYYGKFSTAGKNSYSFSLDSNDSIEEKSETNNTVSRDVEVFPLSTRDLKIESVTYNIAKPLVNEEVEIKVKVKNTGKVGLTSKYGLTTTDDFTLSPAAEKGFYYDLSDITLVEETKDNYPTLLTSLDPGEIFTYTFLGKFRYEGIKTFTFEVDKKKQLTEVNYTDNAATSSIAIYKDATERDKFKIINYSAQFKSSSTVKISWTTDKDSTGAVWYKQNGHTSFVGETLSSGSDDTHSIEFKDLKAGTNYEYNIIAKNGTEEVKLTGVFFTTPSSNEVIFTEEPLAVVSGKNIVVNWKTNLLSYSHLYYRLVGDTTYKVVNLSLLTDSHSVSVNGLADGTYEYYAKSDSSVKTEKDSAVKKFTVLATTQTSTTTPETTTTTTTTNQTTQTNTGTSSISTTPIVITNTSLYTSLKGKIILTVEANGEAYYINPSTQAMNYLGRPDDAFAVMRSAGIGITNQNLNQIQIGLTDSTGIDTDSDGLSDLLEDAIGTNKTLKDTDKDGYEDKAEVAGGHDPVKGNGIKYPINSSFAKSQAGKIFLQVESKGEAWYINPSDNKRYFLGRPADAFAVMRKLGLGISDSNFESLQ